MVNVSTIRQKYIALSILMDALEVDVTQWVLKGDPTLGVVEASRVRLEIIRRAEQRLIKLPYQELLNCGPDVLAVWYELSSETRQLLLRDVKRNVATKYVC